MNYRTGIPAAKKVTVMGRLSFGLLAITKFELAIIVVLCVIYQ